MKRILSIFILACFAVSIFAPTSWAYSKECEYWPNGKIKVFKLLNDMGDTSEISYYREDGSLEQNIKYDINGKKTEESFYNSSGKLRETADGWAAVKLRYAGDQLIQETYFGDDGMVKERKGYNSIGDLTNKEYYGLDGIDPDEEYAPNVPLLSHETVSYYDSYGKPEGKTEVYKD